MTSQTALKLENPSDTPGKSWINLLLRKDNFETPKPAIAANRLSAVSTIFKGKFILYQPTAYN
jgi:hypothetical protein